MGSMKRWAEIRHYIRFDAADEAALRELHPVVRPRFPAIVREFYERIQEHEGARRVFTGGAAQIERQKQLLTAWLESSFAGPWDEVYYHIHSRIGRVHVWIGLEPRYMVLAMHLIRQGLQTAVLEAFPEKRPLERAVLAIAKICDVELAIMIEEYHAEYSAQIKRRERLAAIGQLGASVSHEVKNPLAVIASSVHALKDYCHAAADPRAARHLEKIQRNVEQAYQIVTTLLDFLRMKAPARQAREWNALVRDAADSATLPAGVTLRFALGEAAGCAEVDATQIPRVIANLVQNAAEAMTEGGAVEVATGGDEAGVEVVVRDRGPGIPGDVLPQLFEPLFTTKAVGNGLGLALSKAIVEAHHGSIRAGNHPEGGAEFRVRLPRRGAEDEASLAAVDPRERGGT
jgi:signal transduction histidine kinase